MPSVLTEKGWVVFETQQEADEFNAKMKAEGKMTVKESETVIQMGETVGLVADALDAPELPMTGEAAGGIETQQEADDNRKEAKGKQGFLKTIKDELSPHTAGKKGA